MPLKSTHVTMKLFWSTPHPENADEVKQFVETVISEKGFTAYVTSVGGISEK
jgi:hypothetical protein